MSQFFFGNQIINELNINMNTLILIHSQTGTTLRFAQVIAEKLKAKGASVDLVQLQADPPITVVTAMPKREFSFTNLPDIKKYDLILAGGPIWGFTVSPVAIDCIRQLKDLHGKKFIPLVTMGFPFEFLGGRQGIAALTRQAAAQGAEVLPGQIITQMFRNSQKQMQAAAAEIAASIPEKDK